MKYRRLEERVNRLLGTPVVDDDFPEMMHHVSSSLADLARTPMPKVVCLCGSTRFKREFIDANFRETLVGNIVLTVGWFSHVDAEVFYPSESQKTALDELHKRKIDLADEVLVLNVGGYIGDSTRSEIEYALRTGVPVRYLEPHEVL